MNPSIHWDFLENEFPKMSSWEFATFKEVYRLRIRKLYGRHHGLIDCYLIFVSHIQWDIFYLCVSLPFPFPRKCYRHVRQNTAIELHVQFNGCHI